MIAITVSTNFSDLVPIIINANERFFKHWYWVTDPNDQATIDLIPKNDKHTILYWDFRNRGVAFDKGGALRLAQATAFKEYPDEWYLGIDSDIALYPDFFVDTSKLDPTKLYGAAYRHHFYTKNNFDNGLVDDYETNTWPWGFFQLYKVKNYYTNSYDCSLCDDRFISCWGNTHEIREQNVVLLENVICRHMGKKNQHWQGRRRGPDGVPVDFKI